MGGKPSKTELPEWYSDYAQQALAQADKIAQIGYVPYQGPDVAAFNPQQIAGMQGANDWAAAFGGPGAKSADVSASLMKPTNFGNGLSGYSSFGGYQDALAQLKKLYPGQFDYMNSFHINPVTGAAATGLPPPGPGTGGNPQPVIPPPNPYPNPWPGNQH
jgi:hypothetical protein